MCHDRCDHDGAQSEWRDARAGGNGDQDAARRLVVAHGPALHVYLYGLLGNHADVKDAYQETWLVFFTKSDRFTEHPDGIRPVLLGIARNKAKRLLRMRSKHVHISLDEAEEQPAHDPETRSFSVDHLNLKALDEEQRSVLLLQYKEGEPVKRIAQLMQTSVARVYRLRAAAIERLRQSSNERTQP
jgi:RNA polymerase sigma factor (sigma-70 family)